MQRAYAALGLPYSSQATGQAPTQQAPGAGQTAGAPNTQAQQQLPQQMRPISALGKFIYALCLKMTVHTHILFTEFDF